MLLLPKEVQAQIRQQEIEVHADLGGHDGAMSRQTDDTSSGKGRNWKGDLQFAEGNALCVDQHGVRESSVGLYLAQGHRKLQGSSKGRGFGFHSERGRADSKMKKTYASSASQNLLTEQLDVVLWGGIQGVRGPWHGALPLLSLVRALQQGADLLAARGN